MAVITINGQVGSGARGIGPSIARKLRFDYVDRLILAEAAKRLGATVEALAQKEAHTPTVGERIARFLNTLMERSALAGSGADPYFGPALGVLLGQDYPEAVEEPISRADRLEDERFIETTKAVIVELADEGGTVIIGRSSNIILKGRPDAFHVGLVSSLESRIRTIATRERIPDDEARQIVVEHERARVAFFRRYFQATSDNPADYHMMLNTDRLSQETAAGVIVDAFNTHFETSPA